MTTTYTLTGLSFVTDINGSALTAPEPSELAITGSDDLALFLFELENGVGIDIAEGDVDAVTFDGEEIDFYGDRFAIVSRSLGRMNWARAK